MVGDRAAGLWGGDRLQATLADQLVQQLSVVNNLVVAAHVWVLITQGVEAVCTGHDDLALLRRNALECLVQHLDVLLGQHLEQELITCAASGVTRTTFALAENRELHTSGVQQVGHCAGGLGCVVIVDTCTTNPEQVLGVVEVLDVLAVDRYVDAIGLGLFDPLGTLVVVLAPRIALGFHVLEQATQLGWEVGLHQNLVAAHIHDVVDVLNVHWALLNTSTTVGAGPQNVGIDYTHLAGTDELQQWQISVSLGGWIGFQHVRARGQHAGATGCLCARCLQVRSGFQGVVTQVGDQQLRGQWLGGVPRRALLLAPSTLRTGGEVHEALPSEVLDLADADVVGVWIRILHGQRTATGGHWLGSAQGVTAVGVSLEEDVEECHEAVPCHAPLNVHAHDEQPDHAGQQLDQREDGNQQRRFRQQLRHLHGEEVGGHMAAMVALEGSNLGGLHKDHSQTLDEDHSLHEVGGLGVRTVETRLLFGVADLLANDDQRDDANDGRDAKQFIDEVVDAPVADDWPAALWVEDLNVGLEPDHGAEQEADHHHPVGNGNSWLFRHLGVADDLLDEVHQATRWVIGALQRGLTQADGGVYFCNATDEEHPGGEGEQCANDAQRDGDFPRNIG